MDKKNTSYKELFNYIKKQKKITICSHTHPDGDTIGTSLALRDLILLNSNNIEIRISGDKYPRYLSFMDGPDFVDDSFFNSSLKIVVDTSTKSRIFDKRVETKESIKIDHHPHENKWLMEIGGDYWPATSEILYEMIMELNLQVSDKIKEYMFVSIWTDTNGLTQRNISDQTRDIIKWLNIDQESIKKELQLTKEEKDIIDRAPVITKGNTTFSIYQRAVPNDFYRLFVNTIYDQSKTEVVIVGTLLNDHYRFSIRSKGNLDVGTIAKKMGGGGHFSSAGFRVWDVQNVNEIIEKIVKGINE